MFVGIGGSLIGVWLILFAENDAHKTITLIFGVIVLVLFLIVLIENLTGKPIINRGA
jgi:hypothetical protein